MSKAVIEYRFLGLHSLVKAGLSGRRILSAPELGRLPLADHVHRGGPLSVILRIAGLTTAASERSTAIRCTCSCRHSLLILLQLVQHGAFGSKFSLNEYGIHHGAFSLNGPSITTASICSCCQ